MSLFVLSYYRQENPQTTDINNVKLTDLLAMMHTIPGNAALHLHTAHPPCWVKQWGIFISTGHLKLLQSLLAIMLTSTPCQAYTAWWKSTHLTTAQTHTTQSFWKIALRYMIPQSTNLDIAWTPKVKRLQTSRQRRVCAVLWMKGLNRGRCCHCSRSAAFIMGVLWSFLPLSNKCGKKVVGWL